MAFGIIYDPNSSPIPNRIVRTAESVNTPDWLQLPNSVANPTLDGVINWSLAKWDGSKVVNLTPEEIATIAEAARKADWISRRSGQLAQYTPTNVLMGLGINPDLQE